MPTPPSDEMIRRLQCAEENLSAVIDLIENGESYTQVLHRLLAITAEIHTTGAKMILCQAQSSQEIILNSASYEKRNIALKQLLFLYTILIHYSDHHYEVFHE